MAPDADNDDAVVPEATPASADFSATAFSDVWVPGPEAADEAMPGNDRPNLVPPPPPVAPWRTSAGEAGQRPPGSGGPETGDDLIQLRDALSSYGDRLNHQIELQERLENELAVARATATAQVGTIERLAVQLDLAATEITDLRQQLDTANTTATSQTDTIDRQAARLDLAATEINDLREQLDSTHDELDRLRQELDGARDEIRHLHEAEQHRHGRVVELVQGSSRELIAAIRAEAPDAGPAVAADVDSISGESEHEGENEHEGEAEHGHEGESDTEGESEGEGESESEGDTEGEGESSLVSPSDAEPEAPLLDCCIDDWTDTVVTDSPAASRPGHEGPTLAGIKRWLRRPGAMFVIDGDGTTELAAPGADLIAAREWLTVAVAGLLGAEAPRAEIVFDAGRSGDLPIVADDGGPRVRLTPPGMGPADSIDRIVVDHAPIGPALAAYTPAGGDDGRRPALWVPVGILADLLTGRRTD